MRNESRCQERRRRFCIFSSAGLPRHLRDEQRAMTENMVAERKQATQRWRCEKEIGYLLRGPVTKEADIPVGFLGVRVDARNRSIAPFGYGMDIRRVIGRQRWKDTKSEVSGILVVYEWRENE